MQQIPADLGRLGLGTAGIGNLFHEVADEEARAIVAAAWDGGVRYFDTAPHYGLGLAERRLGAALAAYPRSEYLLSTKVGRLLEPTPESAPARWMTRVLSFPPRTGGCGIPVRPAYAVRCPRVSSGSAPSGSTSPTCTIPTSTTWRAASPPACLPWPRPRRRDWSEPIGIGSKSVAALAMAVRTGLCDLIMVAGRLTILDDSGAELVELCPQHGVGIVNVGVFNSGALAARSTRTRTCTSSTRRSPGRGWPSWSGCMKCAPEFGVSVADAALQYSWQLPAVVNVTVGASKAGQIGKSLAGMCAEIDPALWPALTALRHDAG